MTSVPLTPEAASARPPSTPDEVRVLPASLAQRRLWLMDQFEPGSSFYNLSTSLRLPGALDIAVLERSLDELLRRHETLRTTFVPVDGTPLQRIAPPRPFSLAVIDLRHMPLPDREAEASRMATEEARRPFELSSGPLIRGTLLRLGEQEHQLLLTLHHIISDAWSLGLLQRELRTLYGAFAAGQPAPLPEPPTRYEHFVRWQQESLQGEAVERLLAYWRKQLAGAPIVLELPTDRPRGTVQRLQRASHSVTLPASLTQGLEALAQREDATLFMTLLAGFSTLIHRYSGQEDVVIGTRVTGRTRPELENVVGLVANTLALRHNLSGNPRFVELLARVREVTRGALAHQELPFETLVDDLQPERNLGHSPIFQVMFDLQDELTASDGARVLARNSKTDLTLFMARTANGLSATFDYDTGLFDAERIQRMAGHFQLLLEAAVSQPSQPISSLPLLTEAEWRTLREWNSATFDYPRDRCVHELFSQQAARTPDAPRRHLRPEVPHLPPARRALQPARPPPALPGRRPRGPRRPVRRALRRPRRRPPRHPQGRRRLPPPGPLLPLRASGLHARGRRRQRPARPPGQAPAPACLLRARRPPRRRLGPEAIGRHPPSLRPPPPAPTTSPTSSTPPAPPAGPRAAPSTTAPSARSPRQGPPPLRPDGPRRPGLQRLLRPQRLRDLGRPARTAPTSSASPPTPLVLPRTSPPRCVTRPSPSCSSPRRCSTSWPRQYPATFRASDSLVFGGEAADPVALRELFQHGPPRRLLNGYGPTECTVFSTFHDVTSPPPSGLGHPHWPAPGQQPPLHPRQAPAAGPRRRRPVSSTSPASGLGRGYLNRPSSPPTHLPARPLQLHRRAPASTGRATSSASCPTAASSTWAASTTR